MKKHKPLKRILALVLSCLIALSLLPGAAFAASGQRVHPFHTQL